MRAAVRSACLIAALLLLGGCQRGGLQPHEGYVQVPGGRVWYKIVGHGPKTPLLILHGGPGVSSYYLKPMAALADERPVIFYDQLGGGHSDRPADSTLWTVERFVQEIPRVREALGLKEVHLFGHSWGTILAVEYMLTHPTGVRSVILSSPALSIPQWIRDADSLRATLPDSTREAIEKSEREGTTASPAYQAAMDVFYKKYLARRTPWSPDIDSTFSQLNPAIYGYMQGPSEFTITGTLKNYDRTGALGELHVPVLFTAGEYDEATPRTVRYYASLVPGALVAIVPNAGHLTMQDEPQAFADVIRKFLHEVEAK